MGNDGESKLRHSTRNLSLEKETKFRESTKDFVDEMNCRFLNRLRIITNKCIRSAKSFTHQNFQFN